MKIYVVALIGFLLIGGVASFFFYSSNSEKGDSHSAVTGIGSFEHRVRARGHIHGVHRVGRAGDDSEVRIEASVQQPFSGDSMEEELSAAQKELLDELCALSDAEDRKGLFRLIDQIQASNEWPDGIPTAIHEEAIEALAWIGSDALPELVGYLGSGDPAIQETALDALTDMLSDPDRSDFDRSEMLKSALTYLNSVADTDVLDDIFSDIIEMRHSVQADTLIYILEHGSATVIAGLKDTIEMVIDLDLDASASREDLVEEIKNWASQEENQDDPDDAEYYGASLSDDGEDFGDSDDE